MISLVCSLVGGFFDIIFNILGAKTPTYGLLACAVIDTDGSSFPFTKVVDADVAVFTAGFEPATILYGCGAEVFLRGNPILADWVPEVGINEYFNNKLLSLADWVTQSTHCCGCSWLRNKS